MIRVRDGLAVWASLGLGVSTTIIGAITGASSLSSLLAGVWAAVAGGFALSLSTRPRDVRRLRELGNALGRATTDPNSTPENVDALWAASLHHVRNNAVEGRTFASLLKDLPDGVWIVDDESRITWANAKAPGGEVHPTHLPQKTPIELVPNATLHEAVATACHLRSGAVVEFDIEGPQKLSLEATISPVSGEPGGAFVIFRNVTELRRLEKVRTDFVANVSHELRTPVTAVRGYAETLLAGALADPRHAPKMVEIIYRQADRLANLVDDLLVLSRIEAHALVLRRETIDLHDLAKRTIDTVLPKARSRNVDLRCDVPPGTTAIADESSLERVFLNLLDNAVKYTPAGGKACIAIGPASSPQSVEVEVRDTGIGIDPQHVPRLFERFYRVDAGRSRESGGTGLGLSIVKHLVAAMQGEVTLRSQPGVGTTFTVRLPRRQE